VSQEDEEDEEAHGVVKLCVDEEEEASLDCDVELC